MHFSIDRTVHTMAFDKPVVDHWLERKIAKLQLGPLRRIDPTTDRFKGAGSFDGYLLSQSQSGSKPI